LFWIFLKQRRLNNKHAQRIFQFELKKRLLENVLKIASVRLLEAVGDDDSLSQKAHNEAINLVIRYKHSQGFLHFIKSDLNDHAIDELNQLTHSIAKARGLLDLPESTVTACFYDQMRELLLELSTMALDDKLKKKTTDLMPYIGDVIAAGGPGLGDNLVTHFKAVPLYKRVEALYPLFHKYIRSDTEDPAYSQVLEIQGLNELYAEYSKFNLVTTGDIMKFMAARGDFTHNKSLMRMTLSMFSELMNACCALLNKDGESELCSQLENLNQTVGQLIGKSYTSNMTKEDWQLLSENLAKHGKDLQALANHPQTHEIGLLSLALAGFFVEYEQSL